MHDATWMTPRAVLRNIMLPFDDKSLARWFKAFNSHYSLGCFKVVTERTPRACRGFIGKQFCDRATREAKEPNPQLHAEGQSGKKNDAVQAMELFRQYKYKVTDGRNITCVDACIDKPDAQKPRRAQDWVSSRRPGLARAMCILAQAALCSRSYHSSGQERASPRARLSKVSESSGPCWVIVYSQS